MLQRIQSVFLGVSALFAILNSIFPIWYGKGLGYSVKTGLFATKVITETNLFPPKELITNIPLGVSILLIALLSLGTIFLYANRKLQILLCQISAGIHTLFFYVCYNHSQQMASGILSKDIDGGFTIVFYSMILSFLCTLLALFFIKKDDELVKSVDRIR